MSRIVAGLARSRLIEIAKDSEDARKMRIRATAHGTRLLQKGRQQRIDYLASGLGRLSPHQLSILSNAADILAGLLARWD